jgi:spermidine/putrescine transport system substrate-binding protein
MNFVYDPKIAAKIEDYVNYICPVVGADKVLLKTDPGVAKNPLIFPTKAMLGKVHIMGPEALSNPVFKKRFAALIGA